MTTITAIGSNKGVTVAASTKDTTNSVSGTTQTPSAAQTASNGSSLKEETAKFRNLVEVANDTTGRYSLDDRLAAYSAALKTSLDGTFSGNSDENKEGQQLIGQLWNGPIEKRSSEISLRIENRIADSKNISTSTLEELQISSREDEKIYFASSINRPNAFRNFERPYQNIEQWRAELRHWVPIEARWAAHERDQIDHFKPWIPGGNEASEAVSESATTRSTTTAPAATTTTSEGTPAESLARGLRAITPSTSAATWQTGLLRLFGQDAPRAGFAADEQGRWFNPYRAGDRTGLRQDRLA